MMLLPLVELVQVRFEQPLGVRDEVFIHGPESDRTMASIEHSLDAPFHISSRETVRPCDETMQQVFVVTFV